MTSPHLKRDIKNIAKSPFVMSGIFVTMLRNWFSESTQFKYVHGNTVDSKVAIEPAFLFKPEVVQDRPGLTVVRGDYGNTGRLAIDDRFARTSTGEIKAFRNSCSMMINCISKMPGECEKLAEEVWCLVQLLKSQVRKDFCFLEFELGTISGLKQHEEYKDFYTISITVFTSFFITFDIVEKDSVKINKIIVKINEECDDYILECDSYIKECRQKFTS